MRTLNIAVAGSSGRMGRALLEAIAGAADLRLTAALERAGSPYLKKDAGELIGAPCNVQITDNLGVALKGSDVLIDFTRPEGTLAHLAACRGKSVKMVIGTTGFSPAQKEELEAASKDTAIEFAPNMSVGVNVTLKLLEMRVMMLKSSKLTIGIRWTPRPVRRCGWARWWQQRLVEISRRLPFLDARAIPASAHPPPLVLPLCVGETSSGTIR